MTVQWLFPQKAAVIVGINLVELETFVSLWLGLAHFSRVVPQVLIRILLKSGVIDGWGGSRG